MWIHFGFVLAIVFTAVAVTALSGSGPSREPGSQSRSVQLLDELRRRVNASEVVGLALQGRCVLVVERAERQNLPIDLRVAAVETDTSNRTGEFELYVRRVAAPQRVLLLATSEWAELAAVHSDFNQLRAGCARRGP
jgi:hypothetical protein